MSDWKQEWEANGKIIEQQHAEIARLRAALLWLKERQSAPGCIDAIDVALRK